MFLLLGVVAGAGRCIAITGIIWGELEDGDVGLYGIFSVCVSFPSDVIYSHKSKSCIQLEKYLCLLDTTYLQLDIFLFVFYLK